MINAGQTIEEVKARAVTILEQIYRATQGVDWSAPILTLSTEMAKALGRIEGILLFEMPRESIDRVKAELKK
jgi:hypothetical protein